MTVYFDWNKQYINVLFDDAEDDIKLPNLDTLFDLLTEPTVIIGEATFESFQHEKRRAVIERARREGHTLLTTPTRATGRRWNALGYDREGKDDSIAVKVIRDLAPDVHLKVPEISPDPEWVERRKAANSELMVLRSTFRWAKGPKGGRKIISAKDDYADTLIEKLPPFANLTDVQKIALGDGKVYNKIVIAAVGKAAKFAESTREFDKLAGLYHHGYPSQIRSDLHHWRWRFVRREGKITISEYRRELRWLYHQLRATALTTL